MYSGEEGRKAYERANSKLMSYEELAVENERLKEELRSIKLVIQTGGWSRTDWQKVVDGIYKVLGE